MKKICVIVPDNMVGTIVGLIAEHAVELHVTAAEGQDPAPQTPRAHRKRGNGQRLAPDETRLGRIVMAAVPEDGTRVLRAVLEDAIVSGGFKRESLSPTISGLVTAKLLYPHGKDHVARIVDGAA